MSERREKASPAHEETAEKKGKATPPRLSATRDSDSLHVFLCPHPLMSFVLLTTPTPAPLPTPQNNNKNTNTKMIAKLRMVMMFMVIVVGAASAEEGPQAACRAKNSVLVAGDEMTGCPWAGNDDGTSLKENERCLVGPRPQTTIPSCWAGKKAQKGKSSRPKAR